MIQRTSRAVLAASTHRALRLLLTAATALTAASSSRLTFAQPSCTSAHSHDCIAPAFTRTMSSAANAKAVRIHEVGQWSCAMKLDLCS
jgi:hypothetical protein